LSIFLNGKKMIFDSTKYGLAPLKGNRIAGLQSSIKDVTIGPFDGNMDNLRISDIVRYTEDFVPASDVPKLDSNTRALFYFDGNLKGISALSKEPVEAK